MFYQKEPEKELRFGDVLKGYILASPSMEAPKANSYVVEVELPEFCVVISPCCSIGDKTILLSPLEKIRNSLFNNPYFKEDFTRINKKMPPEKSVPSETWERFSQEEKEKRISEGIKYAFVELFIFAENEIFPEYEASLRDRTNVRTRYYMIDFRNTYKIKCNKIVNQKDYPVESKCLQLTIDTRNELREKISSFFGRIPIEDKIEI